MTHKNYENKIDENVAEIYCRPNTRVKSKFKVINIITFNYSKRKDNTKYLLFIKLFNNLENNFSDGSFSTIDKEDLEKLKNKQREFEKYTINKDTLDLPFPPPPKINRIKFKRN